MAAVLAAPGLALADFVITGVRDRGGADTRHFVELYGTFPTDIQLKALVACNGMYVMDAAIQPPGVPGQQINVAFSERPSGSSCTFQLAYSDGSRRSDPQTPAPMPILPPEIEILGVNDRGITAGLQYLELYGRFPGSGYSARARCAGATPAAARVEYASSGQINISWARPADPVSCSVQVIRGSDGKTSLWWPIRFGGPMAAFPSFFGVYDWGGYQPRKDLTQALAPSAQALRDAGFARVLRLVVTPSMRQTGAANPYNLDLSACAPPFLPCAVTHPAYQTAFSAPGLQTVVLTTYDSASTGAYGQSSDFLSSSRMSDPSVQQAVYAEYYQMARALFQTQRNTGRLFIISNWESDNSIYCAGAYAYVQAWKTGGDTARQQSCSDAQLSDHVQGMTQWFTQRKRAIDDARTAAWASGAPGVDVRDGIEMVAFHMMDTLPRYHPTALRDIVPVVRPAYVSYSSWESVHRGTLDEDLRALKSAIAPSQLVIGEFGQEGFASGDPKLEWRLVETTKAVFRAQPAAAIFWEGYDSAFLGDGLLAEDGSETHAMVFLRAALGGYSPPPFPQPVQIAGLNDRGNASSGTTTRRYLELYGSFPGATNPPGTGYQVNARCDDGVQYVSRVEYESPGQINVSLPAWADERWCTFQAWRKSDWTHSPDFGPRALCSGQPCPFP